MRRTGFTLIELLVVIAIITLLAALTTAALRMARAHAKSVLCQSNVRQLALGLFMYADGNETFPRGFRPTFPSGGTYLGSAAQDDVGWWWLNDIMDFARKSDGQEGTFWCPARKLEGPKLEDNILWGNYGANRSILRTFPASRFQKKELTGTPLGRCSIPFPSRTLLIVDSGHGLASWWYATDSPPWPLGSAPEDFSYIPGLGINEERDLLPGQRRDAIAGRHPHKTVNVGFADGHTDRKKAQDLFVEFSADGYKNSPLWVPR
jgi:prepilin-type N-terminal cleavage/methylation domain-containing protein/prepilin-type processing-associated H-X9-DG protein